MTDISIQKGIDFLWLYCRGTFLGHGFRGLVPVRKLRACCWDMQKSQAKQAFLVVLFKGKKVYNILKANNKF